MGSFSSNTERKYNNHKTKFFKYIDNNNNNNNNNNNICWKVEKMEKATFPDDGVNRSQPYTHNKPQLLSNHK